jgi:hypothetical protein
MALRRHSIDHPARNDSFADDGPAVKLAYSGLLGLAGLARQGCLGTFDMFGDAALAWEKELSHAH